MGLVMIRCPVTGRTISTGIKANQYSFNRSPVFFGHTFCPICQKNHDWFAKDAWVLELTETHEFRSAQSSGAAVAPISLIRSATTSSLSHGGQRNGGDPFAIRPAPAVSALGLSVGPQINIFKFFPRTAIAAAVIVIGIVAVLVALARPLTENERSADGLTANLDVMPAAIVKGHQTMHRGTSNGPHEYHVVAAISDTASAMRISDATVMAKVSGLGLLRHEAKLEPMNIADTSTYGGFFYLPGLDVYTIQLTIQRPGSQQPVVLDFNYDHRNQ
jgi:hypothetical protein